MSYSFPSNFTLDLNAIVLNFKKFVIILINHIYNNVYYLLANKNYFRAAIS